MQPVNRQNGIKCFRVKPDPDIQKMNWTNSQLITAIVFTFDHVAIQSGRGFRWTLMSNKDHPVTGKQLGSYLVLCRDISNAPLVGAELAIKPIVSKMSA